MKWSKYDEVNDVIDELLNGHKQIFATKLSGFYLYGSLVWGDFDIVSSDIDTLCVISAEITLEEMDKLSIMHEKIINDHPAWKDRIEVHYAPQNGLRNFRNAPFKMANISPGEPLHMIYAGIDWIDEWYCVQEYAITLFGIDKLKVIPHIENYEFIQTICGYARSFRERIKECKNSCYSQAYAILTLCRALYTLKTGEQVSKPAAAHWCMEYLFEYRDLISSALIWRHERNSSCRNSYDTYILAETFVDDILNRFFAIS